MKSPRSSSDDHFREKIIIYPYISKRSLELEAKETLNWLRTGPNINEFRLMGKPNIISVGGIENNAIEYTFTYTSKRHGLIKGKLRLAKIPTGFLEFEYRGTDPDYTAFMPAYEQVKRTVHDSSLILLPEFDDSVSTEWTDQ